MKRLDTWIDYGKAVIALILFLIGSVDYESESYLSTLIFLLSALILAGIAEGLLCYARYVRRMQYARYLHTVDREIRRTIRESRMAA